jgi:hypothetical protein
MTTSDAVSADLCAKTRFRLKTRLSASNRAGLLAAYTDGVPVRQLAARFKVHRGTVSEIARRAGLEPRGPTLPQPTREAPARTYTDGLTLVEVGVKLGISHNAVRSAVVACGETETVTLIRCDTGPHHWVLRPLSARLAEDHSRGVVRIGLASGDDG